MDELSAFRNAPPQLLQRESALLKAADVVFTGGPSLYRAKQRSASQRALLLRAAWTPPISQRRATSRVEASATGELPRPRLGYFGVIDERLDSSCSARSPLHGRTGRSSWSGRW